MDGPRRVLRDIVFSFSKRALTREVRAAPGHMAWRDTNIAIWDAAVYCARAVRASLVVDRS